MVFEIMMKKRHFNENFLTGLNNHIFFIADDDDIVIMKF